MTPGSTSSPTTSWPRGPAPTILGRLARRVVAALATGVVVLSGLAVTAPGADATTYQVTNGDNSGPGSFRAAMELASIEGDGPHVITFAPGLTVELANSTSYEGDQPLTIEGNGSTVTGNGGSHRLVLLITTATVTVDHLTFTDIDGAATNNGLSQLGGGQLTVNDSTFIDLHSATGSGALRGLGDVTVNRSRFVGNSSVQGGGGAVNADGALVVNDSVFTENRAAGIGGAVVAQGSTAEVNRSTFVGNEAESAGAGIYAPGGTELTVRDSTFAGNALGNDEFATGVAVHALGPATEVDHTTFSANGGQSPFSVQFLANAAGHTLTRSVLERPGPGTANCGGNIVRTTGHTYSTDSSCHLQGLVPGDVADGPDAVLGPPRDNGGLTPTMFPLAGSPLVDAISPGDCPASGDQRGIDRPFGVGCDIGAIEAVFGSHAFGDVPSWVEDAVRWMASDTNGLPFMTGITPTTFRPNDPITRGQVVRLLYREAGSPDVADLPAHGFSDVGTWVEDAVRWAAANEIATGYANGTFRTQLPITRAQVVRMKYRLAGSPDVSGLPQHGFSDVPSWVRDPVRWAANTTNPLPLATGYANGTFRPNLDITRAQVARMDYRLGLTPTAWDDPDTAPFTLPFRADEPS